MSECIRDWIAWLLCGFGLLLEIAAPVGLIASLFLVQRSLWWLGLSFAMHFVGRTLQFPFALKHGWIDD